MTAADTAAPQFEIDRVVRRTFSVIKNNLAVFALLSLIMIIPWSTLTALQPRPRVWFLLDFNSVVLTAATWLIYLFGSFVLQAAVVHATVADLNGRRASFADCLSTGLKHFVPLLLIAVIYFVVIFIGLILFVVPGIIIAVMLSVAVPARVVEHTGILGAFDRSQDLTKGYRWIIFALLVAYFIVQMIISTITLSIAMLGFVPTAETIAIATGTGIAWPVILASTLAQMINAVLSATGTASIYYELRQVKEGVGADALASVFD
jgi:hypothetical protein